MRTTCTAMFALLIGLTAMAQETSSHPACLPLDPADAKPFTPPLSPSTCSEVGWYGLHGVVLRNGEPVFDFKDKLFPVTVVDAGEVDSCNSHLTAVDPGTVDPIAGFRIPAKAVRIGNRAVSSRADMLAKRFVVEQGQSVIHFSYAVVFQDPDHEPAYKQPSFEVVVLDEDGNVLPKVTNLGDGRDKLIAEKTDPFFSVLPDDLTIFRGWSCGRIDLSGYVGKTVTVQFITEDCTLGAHFAYAYVGDFCSANDCGPELVLAEHDECDDGQICVRATRAQPNDPEPYIELQILVNGAVRQTLTNPMKSGTDTYCFAIHPEFAFDYIVVATFHTGFGTIRKQIEGITPGVNNDYQPVCGTPGCCGGVNLIANGDFEAGAIGFESDFAPASAPRPGQFAVVNATQARAIAPTWIAQSHTPVPACTDDRKFLAVNGETCATGSSVVWSQRVAVAPDTDYRFCFVARNLPQRAFDVVPKLELRFSDGIASSTHVIQAGVAACDWVSVGQNIHIPPNVTAITCEIVLLDETPGDGNDLAIDDVALQKLAGCAFQN